MTKQVAYPDVLTVLEIISHGSPAFCGGITATTAPSLGKLFVNSFQPWGETVSIYLSGCNAGMLDKVGDKSIARQLADAIPFQPSPSSPFNNHVTVHGLNGYGDNLASSLTHLESKTLRTSSSVQVRRGANTENLPPKLPPPNYKPPPFPALGNLCWIPNKNDSLVAW